MIKVDGFYLYTLGSSLKPLSDLKPDARIQGEWLFPLYYAQSRLEPFLNQSVYQLRASAPAGHQLLSALKVLTADSDRDEPITFFEAYSVTSALTEFEHVLNAEFGVMNLYLVPKKRGYDTTDLIQNGAVMFPEDLGSKVPGAVEDINQATRCIAFELPTAAGFHLHRANESVMHLWYDGVTNGATRPNGRNIGDYLAELNKRNVGNKKIISSLKDLKDLHRNPLIHPDDSLESTDEAIALMGSIQAVIVHMLRDIPDKSAPAAVGAIT